MFSEHERDGALWKIEWKSVNEVVILTGAIAAKAKKLLGNLTVDPERMRRNLDLLKGLMMSEPVMLKLGEKVGKQTAHEIIYEISMDTFEENADFFDKLKENKIVSDNISEKELKELLDPTAYTGKSSYFAHRVSENIKRARLNDESA